MFAQLKIHQYLSFKQDTCDNQRKLVTKRDVSCVPYALSLIIWRDQVKTGLKNRGDLSFHIVRVQLETFLVRLSHVALRKQ